MNIIRNYASDEVADLRDIYSAICKGFDHLQVDMNGVPQHEMLKFVMKETKGCVNPMKVMRIFSELSGITYEVKVQRIEILDLLNCAEDYGFDNSILIDALVQMLDGIKPYDIDHYCSNLLKDPQYTEEDSDAARERLESISKCYKSYKLNSL